MITLGVDPGPAEHAGVFTDGYSGKHSASSSTAIVNPLDVADCPVAAAAVIEWPVTIGIPLHRKPLDETMRKAAILADRLHRAGIPVYIPPRRIILQQLGYSSRRDGNADKWVAAYLRGLGYDMKLLRNTHLRSAMAAALWNWRHPQNEIFRYLP